MCQLQVATNALLLRMSNTSRIDKHSLGRRGESLAQLYLTQKGYRVIATRYRTPYGEIDLIIQDDKTLVFVEVKTRHLKKAFSTALTPQQYKRAYQTAEYFLSTHQEFHLLETRFDAIMVNQDDIHEHIEGIWEISQA